MADLWYRSGSAWYLVCHDGFNILLLPYAYTPTKDNKYEAKRTRAHSPVDLKLVSVFKGTMTLFISENLFAMAFIWIIDRKN